MTVKQLIEHLQEYFDPEDEVIQAGDSEGNSYGPVSPPGNKAFFRVVDGDIEIRDIQMDDFRPCVILYPGCW